MTPDPGQIQVGVTLRDARRRNGIEVREVEDRTKIRARYIRALENEEWDALPAPAYIRGFLRTYGQLLGLDGEMLVDLYRRDREEAEVAAGGAPLGEPLLSERRRAGSDSGSGSGGPRVPAVVVAGVAGLLVLIVVLGLAVGGGDNGDEATQSAAEASKEQEQREARQARRERRQERQAEREAEREAAKVNTTLTALTTVEVCLVAGADTALIDNQTLSVNAREKFEANKRYRLSFGPGSVLFKVGDAEETLEVTEPVSFRGDADGIREIDYRGPDCP